MDFRAKFEQAWGETEIIRSAHRTLFTFGDTRLPYIIVSESLVNKPDVVVREGEMVIKRPVIISADSGHPLFSGFGDKDKELAGFLFQRLAYIPPYQYENSAASLSVLSEPLEAVIDKLRKKLDRRDDSNTAILKALADTWEISIMKYALEKMVKSTPSNITELKERGFLGEHNFGQDNPPNF